MVLGGLSMYLAFRGRIESARKTAITEAGGNVQGMQENIRLKDAEIVIENKKVGAGLKITADRPLLRSMLWSVRTVLAVEPYIALDIQPGAEFTWKNTFEYYTLK